MTYISKLKKLKSQIYEFCAIIYQNIYIGGVYGSM